ncbi:hypothetical protein RFI_39358 [Reticulomyxa filosa]|uniref:Uncharacterized protein n=1 Tax=Reticulomyxa filosa TaxID=46433 RepID=X6LAJ2_RETFI|nr:hypothetical protein RFI_39358 [Reticulomyxa filosa]|eukprot:ETN98156.1 hypothetical protein RFI_39358 [Reticulomyxa filosa]
MDGYDECVQMDLTTFVVGQAIEDTYKKDSFALLENIFQLKGTHVSRGADGGCVVDNSPYNCLNNTVHSCVSLLNSTYASEINGKIDARCESNEATPRLRESVLAGIVGIAGGKILLLCLGIGCKYCQHELASPENEVINEEIDPPPHLQDVTWPPPSKHGSFAESYMRASSVVTVSDDGQLDYDYLLMTGDAPPFEDNNKSHPPPVYNNLSHNNNNNKNNNNNSNNNNTSNNHNNDNNSNSNINNNNDNNGHNTHTHEHGHEHEHAHAHAHGIGHHTHEHSALRQACYDAPLFCFLCIWTMSRYWFFMTLWTLKHAYFTMIIVISSVLSLTLALVKNTEVVGFLSCSSFDEYVDTCSTVENQCALRQWVILPGLKTSNYTIKTYIHKKKGLAFILRLMEQMVVMKYYDQLKKRDRKEQMQNHTVFKELSNPNRENEKKMDDENLQKTDSPKNNPTKKRKNDSGSFWSRFRVSTGRGKKLGVLNSPQTEIVSNAGHKDPSVRIFRLEE